MRDKTYVEGCASVVSCRDPDPDDPCYASHECDLPDGHEGPHRSDDHDGMEWTDGR